MKLFRKPVAWILAIPLVCTALVSFKGDDHNFLISKYLDIFHSVFRELDMMYVDTFDVAEVMEELCYSPRMNSSNMAPVAFTA